MSRRIKFGLAIGATSLVAAVGAPVVLAAGDTDDNLSPANTTVKIALKAGTKTTFKGTLGTTAVTSTCTASTTSFKTPAKGLGPVNAATPTFTGCTDNLGGKDTVTANSKNGSWAEKFVDAANDEAAEKSGDKTQLRIPKAGATVVSSLLPTCVITVAPNGPATITAAYNDVNTSTFTNATLPVSTSAACPGGAKTGTATFSATYVSAPGVKDAS
jgi:hypothetical protein